MAGFYVFDSAGEPRAVDAQTWARWFSSSDTERQIGFDRVSDTVHVSTVFLGLDHSFGAPGGPVLFETMIFGGSHDGHEARYRTRDEAVAGHAAAVALARGVNGHE